MEDSPCGRRGELPDPPPSPLVTVRQYDVADPGASFIVRRILRTHSGQRMAQDTTHEPRAATATRTTPR